MAETLTLNTTPDTETLGESLTSDEKESLEIGEKMVEQQEQLLAGKYKNAEELEKAYVELQQKLGSKEETVKEETIDTKEEVKEKEEEPTEPTFLDNLWEESQKEGDFTEETINKLNEMSQQDLAQEYLNYRASTTPTQLSDADVTALKNIAGGDKGYDQMMKWAGDNVPKEQIDMFDAVMDKGDPLSCFFAVQALNYRYNDAVGIDGQMLTGKAAKAEQPGFRSQAELVAAMSDPKYDNDPAFRQDIIAKLERSKNLEF